MGFSRTNIAQLITKKCTSQYKTETATRNACHKKNIENPKGKSKPRQETHASQEKVENPLINESLLKYTWKHSAVKS